MSTRERIISFLKQKESASGSEIARHLGVSRQAVNRHLKTMILERRLEKTGRTRGALYRIHVPGIEPDGWKRFAKGYALKGLEEHVVLHEVEMFLNVQSALNENALSIFRYIFSEMVNNAIDHSMADECLVDVYIEDYMCHGRVKDAGIGIFYSIHDKLNLVDEAAAVGELIKGKTTTMKERHSGEGVFFSSKAADEMSFRSHRINLVFDNRAGDVYIQEKNNKRGTEVTFGINIHTRRKLEDIFKQYAPEEYDYQFEKTRVFVKLFQRELVARSEARRLLSGLDKFSEIVLDFKGVTSIGQGFADEIFRVFHENHPDIIINVENLSKNLKPMIDHVTGS